MDYGLLEADILETAPLAPLTPETFAGGRARCDHAYPLRLLNAKDYGVSCGSIK